MNEGNERRMKEGREDRQRNKYLIYRGSGVIAPLILNVGTIWKLNAQHHATAALLPYQKKNVRCIQ
jgi:hypothetical protein